jgi:hypothetical protein
MEHRSRYFWFTAGHVIAAIKRLLADPTLAIKEVRLRDGLEMPDAFASALPIPLDPLSMAELDIDAEAASECGGFDFGVMRLSPFVFAGLMRNPGTKFLQAADARHVKWERVAGLYVIGAPGETVRRVNEIDVQFDVHCLPIQPVKDSPNGLPLLPISLNGRLLELGAAIRPLSNISGMSGGPVFAVEHRPRNRFGFRLVGIQSAWHCPTRHVWISPVAEMLELIEEQTSTRSKGRRRSA